jgi:regulator of sigma E protease
MPFDTVIQAVTNWIYPAVLVVFFFALTIFIHELGHFLMAKRCNMVIERFFIGFGPRIFSWKHDGVEYGVAWLPFGGYVALPQMAPMEVIEGKTESKPEELPPASPASRIFVAFAGPIMNVVLAGALACIIWIAGRPSNPTIVGWVETGSPEEQAGIAPGDRIIEVNGEKVKTWGELLEAVAFSREPLVRLAIERNGARRDVVLETKMNEQFEVKTLDLYPRERPFARRVLAGSPAERAGIRAGDRFVSIGSLPIYSFDQLVDLIGKRADMPTTIKMLRDGKMIAFTVVPEFDKEFNAARIGVVRGEELEIVRPGPSPARQFAEVFGSMERMVKALFHHRETGISVRNVSGPVGIFAGWWYGIVSGGWREGLVIAVLLNLNLALLNLLPIPVLDGGHIVFAALEGVRRRPLNARLVQHVSVAFAILLISFMLYVTVFDVERYFGRPRMNSVPSTNEPAAKP